MVTSLPSAPALMAPGCSPSIALLLLSCAERQICIQPLSLLAALITSEGLQSRSLTTLSAALTLRFRQPGETMARSGTMTAWGYARRHWKNPPWRELQVDAPSSWPCHLCSGATAREGPWMQRTWMPMQTRQIRKAALELGCCPRTRETRVQFPASPCDLGQVT